VIAEFFHGAQQMPGQKTSGHRIIPVLEHHGTMVNAEKNNTIVALAWQPVSSAPGTVGTWPKFTV